MESYGESKHLNRKNGISSKEKIYSFSTMTTYMKEVDRFGSWLASKGMKRITIEEAKEQIQLYINFQTERGLSPYSINTSLSAVCKATHSNISDYDRPKRSIARIVRGVGERRDDKYNERVAGVLINANKLLGLRRNELKNLRVSDIIEHDNY